ncbi:MAG: hypothetical protein P4L59_13095 [Desulfosporosinus sp.]|nr:hypothetical protein [Desulfosporosinus sp.]
MMQGISGMANSGGMSKNCGMQGMHGNTQINKFPKRTKVSLNNNNKTTTPANYLKQLEEIKSI